VQLEIPLRIVLLLLALRKIIVAAPAAGDSFHIPASE
jgi:hypothetical protein